jgi:4-amino-4-deoxy-L-arabinose transferase-like glycosyltransferase
MNRALVQRLLLLLVPVLAVGLFLRVYYTPDEPREGSLAVAMAHQANHALPELGGETFAEKPPLLYWMGGAVVAIAGPTPAATRVPNLLYGLLTAVALALIARRAAGVTAGVVTGVVAGTALQLYDVHIWLATDAPLVAGVALSLAGMYAAFTTEVVAARRRGYAVLALGLLIAFFAKGLAGWMVPGFAYLTVLVLERRWRELLRPEPWLVVPVLVIAIGAWVLAVLARPDGAIWLKILFWYNTLGRAVAIDAPSSYAYATGHLNSPGKYLLELPLYLLPWTALALTAFVRGRHAVRSSGATGTAWRLAYGAIVPATVLLSCAATARGVYYGPPMLGFALMVGLEFGEAAKLGEPARGFVWGCTRWLVASLALLLGLLALALAFAPAMRDTAHVLMGLIALVGLMFAVQRSVRARGTRERVLRDCLLSVCVTLTLIAAPLWVCLNPLVNLRTTAAEIETAAAGHPLVLLQPDETTIAMSELYLGHLPTGFAGAITSGEESRYLWLVQDRYRWKPAQWLSFLGYRQAAVAVVSPAVSPPADLPGAAVEAVVERAGGRRYAILAMPATRSLSP